MGNGFKRFIDFSPLSVKCLNDQLEQLWLKVMGGITYRDLDSGTQNIIDGKTDEDAVMSMVEQSKDEILMAVGRPGGDNLINNGNWQFDTESWDCSSAVISGEYMHINAGSILQTGIKAEAGTVYTFGFEGYANTPSKGTVYGQYTSGGGVLLAEANVPAAALPKKYRVSFTVPNGVSTCYVKLESSGSFYVKKLYIREGEGVDEYTTNPNEMSGNGLSITENGISISTASFNLGLLDENGRVTSVLSTDGTGFDDLRCSNMTIIDRKYVGSGAHIYVNSVSGSDSNTGDSTYHPFKTVARALKAVPLHIRGMCTIHLSGCTYNEDINLNYGGTGGLTILGENGTLNGSIQFYGTGYNVTVQNLKVFARGSYCVYGYGSSSYAELIQCLLDNNSVAASRGLYITHGFRMYIKNCEINNCARAVFCDRGAYMDLIDCKGTNNTESIVVNDMAIINAEGTVPMGSTITKELAGGRIDGYIIAGTVGTDYLTPRDAIKSATFAATGKFTYNGSGMENGVLRQGGGSGAFLVFDTASVAATLAGRTLKSVKLTVRRRADDANAREGILKAFAHNVASVSGGFSYAEGYGDVCRIGRGEEVSVDIPATLIERMIAGTAKGVLFYDNSGSKDYCFELSNSFSSRLEVLYV